MDGDREQVERALAEVAALLADEELLAAAPAVVRGHRPKQARRPADARRGRPTRSTGCRSRLIQAWTDPDRPAGGPGVNRCEQAVAAQDDGDFRGSYPAETAELDDSIASGPEYRELHDRVDRDDLPRFESSSRST